MRELGGRTLRRASLVFAAAAGLCPAAVTAQAAAAVQAPVRILSFAITSTADTHDAHPGTGRCADSAGRCTLRAALEEARAAPAGSKVTIAVPAGRYRLALGTLSAGAKAGPVSIGIHGAGPNDTVISAGDRFRVMAVAATATVVLDGLEVTGGNAGPDGYGGGVLSSGTLTLTDTLVAANHAGAGGGVDNAGGSLVVTGSRIRGNVAREFGGGGIQNGGPHNLAGAVLVVSSTVSDNISAGDDGGGIFSGQNGHPRLAGLAAATARPVCQGHRCGGRGGTPPGLNLTVLDSDVSGNHGIEGGGISSFGPTRIAGSTITGNSAGGADGGGVWAGGSVSDSTISGNQAAIGGAISSSPFLPLTVTGSTLDANHAVTYGGAINDSADVTVTGSTLARNTTGPAGGTGAAVEIQGSAQLNLFDSTVAGNTTVPAGGGAVDNFGGLAVLSFDTFSGNSGSITGSFLTRATGTILATGDGTRNCAVPVHETAGYNLATDTSCGLARPTDLTGTDPGLGPLAANGGPVSTEALPRRSPAIDAGGLPATSGCPQTDERGLTRPWGPACDIGAFELHYRIPAQRR